MPFVEYILCLGQLDREKKKCICGEGNTPKRFFLAERISPSVVHEPLMNSNNGRIFDAKRPRCSKFKAKINSHCL